MNVILLLLLLLLLLHRILFSTTKVLHCSQSVISESVTSSRFSVVVLKLCAGVRCSQHGAKSLRLQQLQRFKVSCGSSGCSRTTSHAKWRQVQLFKTVFDNQSDGSLPWWWLEALGAQCPPSGWSPRELCLGAAPPPAAPPPPRPHLPHLSSSSATSSSGRLRSPRHPWHLRSSGLHQFTVHKSLKCPAQSEALQH